ncbi:MAG: sulfotransferase [Xanthomonadales bacterium]|nr:sulfotransferase [Xanthomonadales bacterium]
MNVAQDLDARWQRARQHFDAGDMDAAIAELEAVVAQEPRHPRAWLLLARIAQGERRCRAAVEYARNAAAAVHETGDGSALAETALLLQALGESLMALRLIGAINLNQAQALASADKLAQCLGLADQHEPALRLLDHAIARSAPTPALVFMRATTLRHLGRRDEATAEYQRCLDMAPAYAAAMLMLAQHDRHADAPGQLERIRNALLVAAPGEPATAALEYALFIHLDAAGDTDGAWQALMRGAAIKRSSLTWQPSRDAERLDAIREVCRGPARPRPQEASGRVPIFIVGQPRTGTTVMERILGNHSQVASAGELNDFHLQLCWQTDLLLEHVDPLLVRAAADVDLAAVGRGYLQRTGWRGGDRRYLIDKLPANIWYAGLIHQALPAARIICMVRDPLDTCFSNLKELFAGSAYPYSYDPLEAAGHHLRLRELLAHWEEVMPGVVLAVNYEDMVRDPLAVAQRVMEHCGLPFEPECVDLERNITPSATASSSQVREPVHTRGIGAWRRYAGQLEGARTMLAAALPQSAFAAPP